MAENPISTALPADLPQNWTLGQTISPNGTEAGLSQQHGYNYLMKQVNAAQQGVNALGNAMETSASLDSSGKLEQSEIPNIDCGLWDNETVETHNVTPISHQNLMVDGNNTLTGDQSTTLEEHMANPLAHQNLVVDGNAV